MDNNINKELDDILQHFGVKGMKWGVRNKQAKSPKSKKTKAPIFGKTQSVMTGKSGRKYNVTTYNKGSTASLIAIPLITAYGGVVVTRALVRAGMNYLNNR